MTETLVVTGGSGFIGREICRQAANEGRRVIGVSRSGEPAESAPWMADVKWVAADVFEPGDWREHLEGASAVVHTVGTVQRPPQDDATYERINGDSTVLAARKAADAGVESFVFLSAAFAPPPVSQAYVAAKRRAEHAIQGFDPRITILRPGPVYGPDGRLPVLARRALSCIDRTEALAGRLGGARPLSVETVARAAHAAAFSPMPTRALGVEAIRRQAMAYQ